MPNIQTYRDYHYEATVKVSENIRTLAIAELAIVWIFIEKQANQYFIPPGLVFPIVLVVIALVLDFIQYVYKSIAYHVVFRRFEYQLEKKKITENNNRLYVDLWINRISYIIFYTKVIVLTVSYIFLISYVIGCIKIN